MFGDPQICSIWKNQKLFNTDLDSVVTGWCYSSWARLKNLGNNFLDKSLLRPKTTLFCNFVRYEYKTKPNVFKTIKILILAQTLLLLPFSDLAVLDTSYNKYCFFQILEKWFNEPSWKLVRSTWPDLVIMLYKLNVNLIFIH